jgi:PhnB protein
MPEQRADPQLAWIEAALAGQPTEAFQDRLREELERRIHMLMTTGIREGYTTVTPYVVAVEVDRLIEFAQEAFGAVVTHRTKGPRGGTHCELRIGDSMLMFVGGDMVRGQEKLTALHIYVPDTDAVYQQALAAGAASVAAPEDKPYGERQATVKDLAGNLWFIATHMGPTDGALHTVTPYLIRQNAVGMIEFLKAAFRATEIGLYKMPDGRLMHGILRVGDGALEMGEGEGAPSAFYLYVQDADAVYKQAVEAGARSLYTPVDQPYGDRVGGVEDAWGNTWYIATYVGQRL